MIECWCINGGTLEYEDETHTYWFNGKKCISVTQVINALYPGKYDNVDKNVLAKAAYRGKKVHNAIECYEEYGIIQSDCYEILNYIVFKTLYGFKVLEVELPIVIIYKDIVIAGRLDMVLEELSGEICVEDHKSTAKFDFFRVSVQTTLYRYGLQQSYEKYRGIKIGLRGMHLYNKVKEYLILDSLDAEEILDDYIKIKNEKELKNV